MLNKRYSYYIMTFEACFDNVYNLPRYYYYNYDYNLDYYDSVFLYYFYDGCDYSYGFVYNAISFYSNSYTYIEYRTFAYRSGNT